ncbi:MAG: DUF4105 domain-containing protein [Deltaproteobacteria bacterium]|nr:DUF4105 domain-containing protein [Deltaproteobacteria bacterium]
MRRHLALAVLALLAALPARSWAEDGADEGRYRISVLTLEPGEELFARFGHIAFVVEDRETGVNKVYNFGTFDFDDAGLRLKYARGFLEYWLSVTSYGSTVRHYGSLGREMVKRELNLTPAQAEEVARRLEENALPENRVYMYRHYLDNCCTRIRDLVDDVTGGAVRSGRDKEPTGRTFRTWTRRALRGFPVMGPLILFSLGTPIDRPITRWEEEFLPEVLSEDLDATVVGKDRAPLVAKRKIVARHEGPLVGTSPPGWELAVSIGILSLIALGFGAAIVLGPRRVAARLAGVGLFAWGFLGGFGGLVLVLFMCTSHFDTHWNENLLVAPILHFWLLGPALKLLFKARLRERTGAILKWYLAASLGLVLVDLVLKIGPFSQGNYEFLALAAASNALALAALARAGIVSFGRSPVTSSAASGGRTR